MSRSPLGLLLKHRPLARMIARDFYLPGADRDDVEQEALIALWAACRSWEPARGATFAVFARHVIRRRLSNAVRDANSLRHRPLNESVRDTIGEDGELLPVVEMVPGGRDPLEVLVDRERVRAILSALDGLTELEREALRAVASGASYRFDKQMDNAVQRARRKLRAAA